MGLRQSFQKLLKEIEGVSEVYFQAPANNKMEYPCIVYSIDREDAKFADNNTYHRTVGYQVTVIDRNPDSHIPAAVAALPLTSFQRFFVVDGLNHFVYSTFF